MNTLLKSTLVVAGMAMATHATAQVTFYEGEGYAGQSFTTQKQIGDFARHGFNDRASSVVVLRDRWEICEEARFGGRCVVLREGRYPSLASMGLNDRVSSVRAVNKSAQIEEMRYAPAPVPMYDSHRRHNERLYQAEVTSVRAVLGPPEQRCWIEQEQVVQNGSGANVPGALVGAVIGGILGHQIGSGRGNSVATAGGAVAGAVVGANVARGGGQQVVTQDIQRCASVPSQGRPDHWDVTYTFRGQDHRMQMAAPPGSTLTVNRKGEPRA